MITAHSLTEHTGDNRHWQTYSRKLTPLLQQKRYLITTLFQRADKICDINNESQWIEECEWSFTEKELHSQKIQMKWKEQQLKQQLCLPTLWEKEKHTNSNQYNRDNARLQNKKRIAVELWAILHGTNWTKHTMQAARTSKGCSTSPSEKSAVVEHLEQKDHHNINSANAKLLMKNTHYYSAS